MNPLIIPRPIFHALVEQARKQAPIEACGILGGREDRRRSLSPHDQYGQQR
jgi:proteasome lid subunit RPN8/RPN11